MRFNTLMRAIPGVSHRMLTLTYGRLSEMVLSGARHTRPCRREWILS
jgi:DNA-binding HxlR family transcriptional regulator